MKPKPPKPKLTIYSRHRIFCECGRPVIVLASQHGHIRVNLNGKTEHVCAEYPAMNHTPEVRG